VPRSGPPDVCAFGLPRPEAVKTVALIGDSHAVHWRAALEVVARAKRWQGLSIYRTQCPLSTAVPLQRPALRAGCIRWKRQALRWLTKRPDIDTIIVSQHSGGGVQVSPGQRQFAAKVAGYINAWHALPATVAHVIVIRDTPYNNTGTLDCVTRAMRRHRSAGEVCALPRATALRPDPAVAAVEQLNSPRFQAIDMTHFMCDRQRCFPVVGGALVRKDLGHLTRVFATTLGPFLVRRFNRLIAGWASGA
jgi:SGNH domain (fused to AT3 domains)